MTKSVDLIGVQIDLGASRSGVAMGPLAIRYGGVAEGLEACGYSVLDKGDIIPLRSGASRDNMKNYEQIIDANHRLYDAVYDTLANGHFPVILGGDHSLAAGSVSASAKFYEKDGGIGVIWIDAHGDWNNEETTPSGSMHGMPFSAVCGHGPDCMVDYGQEPAFVDVSKCVVVGARDLDELEKERMKKAGMTVYTISDVDKLGIRVVMDEAIARAGSGAGIHLSFDVDSITPEDAPGTGTPVAHGLTTREAYLALEMLAESRRLIAMDMVEVNPILDVRNKTGKMASELIQSALGKTIY